MSHVIIIQHVDFEGPGTIADALRRSGVRREIRKVFAGDPVPDSADDISGLVIMGGPMGVHDADRYPFLEKELDLIRSAIEQDVPVLGVCLGSQLLAQALGAEVTAGAVQEFGWHRVTLTDAADSDPLFDGIDDSFTALHWHRDVFALPDGGVALASSKDTAIQAFRWGDVTFGIVFHLECSRASLQTMADASRTDLGPLGIQLDEIVSDSRRHMSDLQRIGALVFERWANIVRQADTSP